MNLQKYRKEKHCPKECTRVKEDDIIENFVGKGFPDRDISFWQDYFLLLYAVEQKKFFYSVDFERSNDLILHGSIDNLAGLKI